MYRGQCLAFLLALWFGFLCHSAIDLCIHVYVCMYVCVYVCMHVCMLWIYVYVVCVYYIIYKGNMLAFRGWCFSSHSTIGRCMYASYVCMHVRMYVCMFMCVVYVMFLSNILGLGASVLLFWLLCELSSFCHSVMDTYIFIYVCMYVCMYVCIHTHIPTVTEH
jgi:hypothetical protein